MTPTSVPPALEAWIQHYVAEESQPERAAAWAAQVTEAILREMPELAAVGLGQDVDLRVELELTVRQHWLAFLDDFRQDPSEDFRLVPPALALAAEFAERHLPLETLIHVYRVAQQEAWNYVSGLVESLAPHADAVPMDRADLLIYFWSRAGRWLDLSVSATVDAYQQARSRAQAGAAAQRYESVRAIVAGEIEDPREASALLGGYPISVHHTAVVLSVTEAEQAGSMEQSAAALARRLGVATPLTVKPGGRQLWMWLGTRAPLDLSELPHSSAEISSDSLSVGIGSSSSGLAGFVTSHLEALGALGLAVGDDDRWLTRYPEVELQVLLGCTPEVDRFVARTLGDLGGPGETNQRIRDTVACFLQHGGSADDAARALQVHRNTVRYRVAQAEEALGRPVARISAELSVALQHHDRFHRG